MATTSSLPHGSTQPTPRRAVTVTTDTGRVPWSELSVREKAARTTQQSVNLAVLLVALGLTAGVSYVLYTEVFSTESKTAVFNRCADRVRQDKRCVEILAGKAKAGEIEAYGEPSWSRWARNRTIACVVTVYRSSTNPSLLTLADSSRTETDGIGTMHMYMHFNVAGPLNSGVVNVHMTRRKHENDFQYHYLALDVPGQERIWLENADQGKLDKRSQGKMFGVKWW